MPIINKRAKTNWKAGDLCYFHKGENNIVACGRITRTEDGVAIIDNVIITHFPNLFETHTEAITALKK